MENQDITEKSEWGPTPKPEKDQPVKKRVHIDEKSLKRDKKQEKGEFRKKFDGTRFWWRGAAVLFVVGFVFQVLSFSLPYWLTFSAGPDDVTYVGLWCKCNGTSISTCSVRNETNNCMNTVRGFAGIALICGVIVCFNIVCFISQIHNRRCLLVTKVVLCFIIALTSQISTATFGRTNGCTELSNPRWSWGGALAFLSILLAVGAGACFFVHELRQCSGLKKGREPKNNIGLIAT